MLKKYFYIICIDFTYINMLKKRPFAHTLKVFFSLLLLLLPKQRRVHNTTSYLSSLFMIST